MYEGIRGTVPSNSKTLLVVHPPFDASQNTITSAFRPVPPWRGDLLFFLRSSVSLTIVMANRARPTLPPPRGTFTEPRAHPSRGGNPYSDDIRKSVIARYLLGIPLDSPSLNALRAIHAFPHMDTCMRYIRRFHECGHFRPKIATGNHTAEHEIRGQSLINLALFRCVHPEATIDHTRAFLFNMDPMVTPFTPIAVVRAEKLLDLRKKAASTTCERAYLPVNKQKRQLFWRANYPHGREDVRTRDMIDMDEAGFKVEASNPKFGKVVSWLRCYLEGQYNRDAKLNCMMAIAADRNYDMEWHDLWRQEEGGTDLYRVYVFFDRIMDRLAVDHPGRSFCFTMDNLNTHKHPAVLNLIRSRGHRYLFRAPYWSVDGPMEYIFNTIHTHLLMYFNEIRDLDELENALDLIIAQLDNFWRYFDHVGFPNT